MKNRVVTWLLSAALCVVPADAIAGELPSSSVERPARISTEYLAQLPEVSNAALSPDGSRLAFMARAKGHEVIVYRGIHEESIKTINLPPKVDFNWLRWAGPNKLLFSLGRNVPYFGEEARQTILGMRDLVTGETSIIGNDRQGLEGDDVLFVDPEGQYLLLSIQRTVYDYPSVFRVALPSGKMSEIVNAREPVWEWYADNAGIVRAGIGWNNHKLKFYYRRTQEERFNLIGAVKAGDDAAFFDIANVVAGSDDGYVLSDEKTGRQALYKFNYRTREIGDLVYGDDTYDLDDFWLNFDGTALEGVSYTDDRSRIEWFDAGSKKLQAQLDRAIPGRQAWVVSKSRDAKQVLVLATAPDEPGLYYFLDRTKGEMSPVAAMMRGLAPEVLAATRSVTYAARDGTKIHAFLTLPKGRDAKSLPLIVYPHGGPFGVRDRLEYDPYVQFFANRGYAVLQPNFRGSGGYGTAFGEAGIGQIGKTMQDDLDDGMDSLVEQGTVDKARVCMIGASYGGYAALWAVARNPDRYRCAASFAGVADWKAMLKYDARYLTKEANAGWQARVTGAGELDLPAISPTYQAVRIVRPVLIGHGADDSNVPISQSKKLVAALKAAGNGNFEYVAYPDEGHGFSDPAHQKDWLDRLDAFLAKHNPAE